MTTHLLRKIDKVTGLFLEDVFFDDADGTLPLPNDAIYGSVPGGFYHPKWDGAAWVEGGTAPIPTPEQLREAAKAARTAAVAAITVTTSTSKTFDGDETSQTRMARAIIGMQAAGVSTIGWTLADNTTTAVTLAELTEAMILAGQQQAAMWVLV